MNQDYDSMAEELLPLLEHGPIKAKEIKKRFNLSDPEIKNFLNHLTQFTFIWEDVALYRGRHFNMVGINEELYYEYKRSLRWSGK